MVNISFLGDIGLNDDYINLYQKRIDPFRYITPYLSHTDLIVGNLECLAEGNNGENLLKRPRLRTTPETLNYLQYINLGLVSLATNHIYDNLEDGFHKTIDFLKTCGISHLGAGINKEETSKAFLFEKNSISFCFLNYITPDTNPSLPENAGICINEFERDKCIDDLRKYSKSDYRIVLMHWGGKFEGGLFPDYNQISIARILIDNGADLIIGHHTHTLQPYEKYKGKYIFYSLGNFCFSDIKFEGIIRKMSSLRERESVIVCANFSKNGYTIILLPFRNENLILHIRRFVWFKLINRNVWFRFIKIKPFWIIYRFYFLKIRPLTFQLLRKDEKRTLLTRIMDQLHINK